MSPNLVSPGRRQTLTLVRAEKQRGRWSVRLHAGQCRFGDREEPGPGLSRVPRPPATDRDHRPSLEAASPPSRVKWGIRRLVSDWRRSGLLSCSRPNAKNIPSEKRGRFGYRQRHLRPHQRTRGNRRSIRGPCRHRMATTAASVATTRCCRRSTAPTRWPMIAVTARLSCSAIDTSKRRTPA
jgi:hypothetical protein